MKNIFNNLMELIPVLMEEGYKISSYTLLDIKNERTDREITIINNDNFKLFFNDNKLYLSTTYSGRVIDDNFIKEVNYLNMIKNHFNENIID